MDLEVRVQDRVIICKLYREVEALLIEELQKWNNFDDRLPFTFTITRVANNDPPQLSVTVNETIDTADLFGRH